MKFCLTLFSLLALSTSIIHSTEVIKMATVNYPPFYGEKLKDNGPLPKIALEAFKSMGIGFKIEFMTWNRALRLGELGETDGAFGCWHTKEREKHFNYSDPLIDDIVYLIALKENKTKFEKLSDLKGKTIGSIKGYNFGDEWEKADYINKREVWTYKQLFKLLENKRIDFFWDNKFMVQNNWKNEFPGKKKFWKFLTPPLSKQSLYLCFSKKRAESKKDIVKVFNKGLKKIKESGLYDKIINESTLHRTH